MLKRTEPQKLGRRTVEQIPYQKKKKKKKKKTHEKDTKETVKCHVFVKQVCFSYGESPQTPPLEGISLHRRNISVERP